MGRREATLDDVRALVRLQRLLAAAFVAQHGRPPPTAAGWLAEGEVAVDRRTWTFCRHGLGYEFRLQRGRTKTTVVDFATHFPDGWDAFEPWHLATYLGSLGLQPPGATGRPLREAVPGWLEPARAAGTLVEAGGGRLRFAVPVD